MRRRLLSLLLTLAAFIGVIVANTGTAHASNTLWSQTYGSGYGGNRDVWSNRNPTWRVGGGPDLVFQPDCNLVLYLATGSAVWASNTAGIGPKPCLLRFQTDGNIVIYTSGHPAWWATNTYANGTVYYDALVADNPCFNNYRYQAGFWTVQWQATNPGGDCNLSFP